MSEVLLDAPFDRVIVEDEMGRRSMSPGEFFALPLSERIGYVIRRKAAFYQGAREVDRQEALNSLRKARIAS